MPTDIEKIQALVNTWLKATAENDLETVLTLMAEDAVFLGPGRPPLRGRKAFADATRTNQGNFSVLGKPDIQEILVEGDLAYCWNYLSLTIKPKNAPGPEKKLAGHILSVLRRESNGNWVIIRDANMLTPQN